MNGSEDMNRSHHGAHLCVEGDEGGLAGGDVVFGCDKVVCGVLLVDADLPSLDRCGGQDASLVVGVQMSRHNGGAVGQRKHNHTRTW